MVSRRDLLLTPAALLALRTVNAQTANGKMTLGIHQNTSSRAGYRGSLEGWAKAGIKNVEITNNLVDAFVKTDSLTAARRVLTDLGLTPVSGSCGVGGLIEPNQNRAASLDNLKKRCEMFSQLGLVRTYSTTASMIKPTADDYKVMPDNVREVGEIGKQFGMTVMFEFVRQSPFAATLPTILSVMRTAAHPNAGILFDCYHFWSGNNKLEDLDLLKPGDIKHVHFQDVPDMPRELLDQATRVIPGDGVTPLTAILQKLASKAAYSGALSVELFAPKFQESDPFEVAREIKTKGEAVMRRARVI
jgi:2-keto-myo-inositol isomerase